MTTRLTSLALTLILVSACGGPPAASTARLELPTAPDDPVVLHLRPAASEVLAELRQAFAVFVSPSGSESPSQAIQGSYELSGGAVRFRPDFPFVPGVDYLVRVDEITNHDCVGKPEDAGK